MCLLFQPPCHSEDFVDDPEIRLQRGCRSRHCEGFFGSRSWVEGDLGEEEGLRVFILGCVAGGKL